MVREVKWLKSRDGIIRELKQNTLVESSERERLKQRIKEMQEFLEQKSAKITVYDE